ncbi:head-tail connector protein [Rhizobium sp. G21]|uniref:head-tail connector protein n=1 Tax=Rhizobium sp. G21 TaxID=2758439 RepID=UPI001601B881|nr:head-tail connector protein [Rhizobium sp. G21]MBB1248290.1 phage head-tail connector protein [Rhizobium sp. G21]
MTIINLAPPGAEPLTLAQAKAHLKIDHTDEDGLITSLIATAREHLEQVSGLALVRRPMRLYLDRWPETGLIEIARGPVTAVDAVRIFDADGAEGLVDLAGHVLDGAARPARLWLKRRPETRGAVNGVEVDFTAGFGDTGADIPDTLKRAMLTHVALMHGFRAVVSTEMQPAGVPDGYDRLIAPYRMMRL